MAHLTVRSAYKKLTDRINLYPQGAPPTAALFKILQLLFSEVEAALVAQLPIKPFTAKKAARLWRKPESEAQKVLDTLAGRGVLVDVLPENGPAVYCLPPPMAGFFEFSLMRLRSDIDQKLLA
ncbi:MAG TPA: (Fe-S)-binding protein, partial [Patescibacteria group bacterium]|nr:(Fe-S)-binding protein [Patescibacteria group bacterium]